MRNNDVFLNCTSSKSLRKHNSVCGRVWVRIIWLTMTGGGQSVPVFSADKGCQYCLDKAILTLLIFTMAGYRGLTIAQHKY